MEGMKAKREVRKMFVVLMDGCVKAVCYNERDASTLAGILGAEFARIADVPIVTFHDEAR